MCGCAWKQQGPLDEGLLAVRKKVVLIVGNPTTSEESEEGNQLPRRKQRRTKSLTAKQG
jgi:hypothetical protein